MIFYSVHFNRPDFIPIQKECVEELADGKLVIINNGPSSAIRDACRKHGVAYHNISVNWYKKLFVTPSGSHAIALNHLKGIIDYSDDWCILDHDLFPLKKIEFADFDIVSIIQERPPYGTYLWPGFMAGKRSISLSDIDFSPMPGMDTGAGTSKFIERGYTIKNLREEVIGQKQNNHRQNSSVIVKIEDYGIHYLNGSSWLQTDSSVMEEKNKAILEFIDKRKNNIH